MSYWPWPLIGKYRKYLTLNSTHEVYPWAKYCNLPAIPIESCPIRSKDTFMKSPDTTSDILQRGDCKAIQFWKMYSPKDDLGYTRYTSGNWWRTKAFEKGFSDLKIRLGFGQNWKAVKYLNFRAWILYLYKDRTLCSSNVLMINWVSIRSDKLPKKMNFAPKCCKLSLDFEGPNAVVDPEHNFERIERGF